MASVCAELQQLLLGLRVSLEETQDKTDAWGKTQMHVLHFKHIASPRKEISKTLVGLMQWHCLHIEATHVLLWLPCTRVWTWQVMRKLDFFTVLCSIRTKPNSSSEKFTMDRYPSQKATNTFSHLHRTTEHLKLEGTLGGHLVQVPCSSRATLWKDPSHYPKPEQAGSLG